MGEESNKPTVENEESQGLNGTSAVNATRKQKLKRHCGRFWWIYAIALVVVVLVTVLPIVYVAYPNKAQDAINDSDLEITSQGILDPAPDSFQLQQTTVFLTNSSLSGQLDEWTGDLCLEKNCETPFARIQVPAAQGSNGTEVHINERTQVTNSTAFNNYTRLTLMSQEYSIYLKGKGGLSYGGLPKTTVNYDKKITMKGLNGLAGFNVTKFTILTKSLPDGSNANATVTIPNPSVSTYEMGNLTMSMSVNGLPIGIATLRDVVLRPGLNTFSMLATTNQTAVVGLIFGPYKSGILPIDIVGNSTVYNGQHIPWYEQALQANKLTIHIDVIKALWQAGLAQLLGITTNSSSKASA